MDFFEIISENFMVAGGKPRYHLDRILESYRVIQHGVSLGIGAPGEPDREYLAALKQLVRRVRPAWLSDPLCWSGAGGAHLHDLERRRQGQTSRSSNTPSGSPEAP